MCEEYMEAASLEERERERSSGSIFFLEMLRVALMERPCKSRRELVKVIVCTPAVIDFSMLSLIHTILLLLSFQYTYL